MALPHIKKPVVKVTPKKVKLPIKEPKFPAVDSVWILPDSNESLWETVPVEDELFKIYHYMDKNKSYRTTYGKMNEWMGMEGGRDMRTGIPVTLSDGNWEKAKREDFVPEHHKKKHNDYDLKFHDSYADLTSKIAYRYPNPGLPRLRQGRIGGSWRHIKEVLGHGGSRVCYVDGLVGVYDQENFNQTLQSRLPYRPHLRRVIYSANRGFNPQGFMDTSPAGHKPQVEELPMISDNEKARKLAIQSSNKHKGVYRYN